MLVAIFFGFLLLECTWVFLSDGGVVAFSAPFSFFCPFFFFLFFFFVSFSFSFFLVCVCFFFLLVLVCSAAFACF